MPRCVRFTWRPAACPQTDGSAPSRSAYPIRTPRRTPVLCHAKLKAWESMSQRQRASAGALGCQGRGSAFPSRITLCRQGWLQRGPRLGLRSCPEERDESAHWTVDATTDAVHEWFRRQLDPRGWELHSSQRGSVDAPTEADFYRRRAAHFILRVWQENGTTHYDVTFSDSSPASS